MWIASRTTSLPRNEKERLLTPPLILTPGQLSLIRRVASMKLMAYFACSSSPVAMARMFGSKMMSLGSKPDLLGEQPVGALADLDLALGGVGLSDLVEGHHDDARAVALHQAGLGEEVGLAFLEADRVRDALALDALEAGLDHRPLRAVDHHRDPRDLGLGGDQVEEGRHRLLGIEHALVHVDVEQVGARAHLVERHLGGLPEVALLDQVREAARAGDVGALADHREVRVGADREGLEAAEAGDAARRRGGTRGGTSATASAMARMCASVVPQQPPTRLTSPLCANSRINAAVWSGVSS